MAGKIPEGTINEIRERVDLVELAGEYLKLERRGRNMVGLCPFHSEKTPSFSVSPEKQFYHCFGCGASGNAFSLAMHLERLSFPEAVRFLAGRAGVSIPEPDRAGAAVDNRKEELYNLNALAARYYHYCLLESRAGGEALDYLGKRGIDRKTIELFQIGFAPGAWTPFLDFTRKKDIDPGLLVRAGLVSTTREKGYYDRFRGRIMFPIAGLNGKISGFGGRTFNNGGHSGPKYLNSPETPVFSKGSLLYGLHLAREEIRKEKIALVMEGYTDVIAAFQVGIKNCVASLGTALTPAQARLLRSQADTVITAYDSDSAGQSATWRGLSVLQGTGCLVRITELPAGLDPDSYIREQGGAAFSRLVEKAVPLLDYRLARLRERFDPGTDRGRRDYIEELLSFLPETTDLVEQDYYLKMAAEDMGIDESYLRGELQRRRRRGMRQDRGAAVDKEEGEAILQPAEKILVTLMLQSKEIARQGRNNLQVEYIRGDQARQIFAILLEEDWESDQACLDRLLARLEDPALIDLVNSTVADPSLQDLPLAMAKRMADDCISQLRLEWRAQKKADLMKKLKVMEQQGNREEAEKLLREHQRLILEEQEGP